MRRIASLGLVLVGFALELLTARFWAEVPGAEAAKKVTWRCSTSRPDMVGLAADLVDPKVGVMLAAGPGTAFAVRYATRQIPIVFTEEPDAPCAERSSAPCCHAGFFMPETACDGGNRLLDRLLISADASSVGYFVDPA